MSLTAYMREFESRLAHRRLDTGSPTAFALAIARAGRDPAGETIAKFIASEHHKVDGLAVKYERASRTVVVTGIAPDHPTRDNVAACCRKVIGVLNVTNLLSVAAPVTLESQYQLLKGVAVNA